MQNNSKKFTIIIFKILSQVADYVTSKCQVPYIVPISVAFFFLKPKTLENVWIALLPCFVHIENNQRNSVFPNDNHISQENVPYLSNSHDITHVFPFSTQRLKSDPSILEHLSNNICF